MRIGFFTDTYTPQINGVVRSIQLFKRALEDRGHHVYVFAPDPEHHEDGDETVRFRSVPFALQPEMRVASPVSIEALRLLDAVDLDVIHSHDPFAISLFGLQVARRHRIPYVHTYHTLYPEYVHYVWETQLTKKLAERLSRVFCQRCDSIVAPSTKIERYLREWGVTVPIEVIATGVDIQTYSRRDETRIEGLRSRLGLKVDDRVLLFVGRLGREKNVDLLIRALWHCRHPQATLVVAGGGPHRAALEAQVAEMGLSERVRFAGYLEREDVVAAYHIADLFTFASTTETQGLVIGEAMAAGLPVVAAEDEAVEDFVIDGECGFVTHARPEDLARAIDTLLAEAGLRSEMSRRAGDRALEHSIERQAEKLEGHYARAIHLRAAKKRRFRLPKALAP